VNNKYLETIKILDGKVEHLEYHQKRMNSVLNSELYKLSSLIEAPKEGLFRCRVVYDKRSISIEYYPYQKRNISSLKLIEDNKIEYSKKYLHREKIDELFAKRESCNDILIVKNSLITDTSIANVAFFDGVDWLTPKKPLLKGTTRQRLLEKGQIIERDIYVQDLKKYKKVALMNAMIDFDIIAKEKIEEIIC